MSKEEITRFLGKQNQVAYKHKTESISIIRNHESLFTYINAQTSQSGCTHC